MYEGVIGMQRAGLKLVNLIWDPTGDLNEEELWLALSLGATFTLNKYIYVFFL